MLFNSHVFILLFLPVVWVGSQYLRAADKNEWNIAFLVASSLVFYGYWNVNYLLLIMGSIVFNYSSGQLLERKKNNNYSRLYLFIGVSINLLLLAYYKYAGFFVENTNVIFGTSYSLGDIILPLAISFFTFQQITYLVDSAKGLTSEHRFSHYCLYVTFFPQLIAGPIVHHKDMLPQFTRRQSPSIQYSDLAVGLTIFTIGLFKKVIVADNLSPYVGDVFQLSETGTAVSFSDAWVGALAYTFQLYFDFSGYADMAIGIARMFSVRLPLNFNSPYKSDSIIEFWRRWHMTLSRFLKDYLYIPLGGSKKGSGRRYINLWLTMLLGGLWHGAGWTFVAWGCLHGCYLVFNHGWRLYFNLSDCMWWRYVARVLTMLAVVVAWVLFRATDISSAAEMLTAMIGVNGFSSEYALFEISKALPVLILLFLWVWLLPNTQELMKNYRPAFDFKKRNVNTSLIAIVWRPNLYCLMTVFFALFIALINLSQLSEFIYFQF